MIWCVICDVEVAMSECPICPLCRDYDGIVEVCKSCEEPLHGGLRELPIREGFEDNYVITCNDCGRYKFKGEEE